MSGKADEHDDDIQDLLDELEEEKEVAKKPKDEPKADEAVVGMIKVKEIIMPEENREHDPDKMNELVNSIKDVGLLIPVILNRKKELLDGVGRIEACKRAGIKEVPFIVKNMAFDETTVIANYMRENLTEKQVKDILKKQDGTQKEIAEKFGISQPRVSQILNKGEKKKKKKKKRGRKKSVTIAKGKLPENVAMTVQGNKTKITFVLDEKMLKSPFASIKKLFGEIKNFKNLISEAKE